MTAFAKKCLRNLGVAAVWGTGGPEFESRRSDQTASCSAGFPHPLEASGNSEILQVHKRVHRHALRMATLTRDDKGNYKARKRLPDDVREEYGGASMVLVTKPSSSRQQAPSGTRLRSNSVNGLPKLKDGSQLSVPPATEAACPSLRNRRASSQENGTTGFCPAMQVLRT